MLDYRSVDTATLVDLLAQQTAEYTHMLADNEKGDTFYDLENSIYLLQLELCRRNVSGTIILEPRTYLKNTG